ncbi:hypothetical protein ACFOLF_07980 [Paenibacillus sepulcri]|uniref:SGNH/GDSL hydrolase family protein n=1 Tax=Paenibacillus sepulcri TaxID=359917 RepID=A0ABS7C0I9_9BACL|nr:SGNH/GDSL hydrolase family protein [Paenibacillus sepulcri]
MRNVMVIGDSISIQYGPFLSTLLAGRFCYDRKRGGDQAMVDLDKAMGANGGDSSMVLSYLKSECKSGVRYDILLLNCGLHDMKTDPRTRAKQVPLDSYEDNLKEIAKLAMEMANGVVWIRTTDVVEELHNIPGKTFHRFHEDVMLYNAAADSIFAELGIPRIDLYSLTRKFGNSAYCDHVHFVDEVRRLQAAFIAGFLESRFDNSAAGS